MLKYGRDKIWGARCAGKRIVERRGEGRGEEKRGEERRGQQLREGRGERGEGKETEDRAGDRRETRVEARSFWGTSNSMSLVLMSIISIFCHLCLWSPGLRHRVYVLCLFNFL